MVETTGVSEVLASFERAFDQRSVCDPVAMQSTSLHTYATGGNCTMPDLDLDVLLVK